MCTYSLTVCSAVEIYLTDIILIPPKVFLKEFEFFTYLLREFNFVDAIICSKMFSKLLSKNVTICALFYYYDFIT